MNEEKPEQPQGVVRDDGCVCPEPEVKKECKPVWRICPYDPRYPQTNQTSRCFDSFVDYQRCTRLLGADYSECNYFLRCYRQLCPFAWIEKWYEQMEKGTFPYKIYPSKPIVRPPRVVCVEEEEEEPPPPPHC